MDEDIVTELTKKRILHWNYRELLALPEELKENGNAVRELYLRQNRISELASVYSFLYILIGIIKFFVAIIVKLLTCLVSYPLLLAISFLMPSRYIRRHDIV